MYPFGSIEPAWTTLLATEAGPTPSLPSARQSAKVASIPDSVNTYRAVIQTATQIEDAAGWSTGVLELGHFF